MRANVSEYDLIAPATLDAALAALSDGRYTPIAGGTELMVALAAGRLPHKPLLSINHLKELRFLDITSDSITIGSGTTFTDLRRNSVIASDFTLLSQAASWTGSIANQNRGTLGGNVINASPAADSLPALLVYDAVLTLISASGTRTIPYRDFHLGYKKTAIRPDELLHSITMRRDFSGYVPYSRKVGTRNAQAISKVAIAALSRVSNGLIEDIRIGAASMRDAPIRLTATEAALRGKSISDSTIAEARAALLSETRPIDDIRSTGKYRSAVAANLLEEFLRLL
ncbi:FAD binding domain-containing protein [Granulicella arctica]|uniref:FAD binding domain-containing protein n=1 Tax=Granulicella arctica TaxID=940613 RepID=UPI0021DFFDE3|nr:FAD binding domain-containing protein [Granulicella arctica]